MDYDELSCTSMEAYTLARMHVYQYFAIMGLRTNSTTLKNNFLIGMQ